MFDSMIKIKAMQTIKETALVGRKIGAALLGPKPSGATGGVSKSKASRKSQRKARKTTRQR